MSLGKQVRALNHPVLVQLHLWLTRTNLQSVRDLAAHNIVRVLERQHCGRIRQTGELSHGPHLAGRLLLDARAVAGLQQLRLQLLIVRSLACSGCYDILFERPAAYCVLLGRRHDGRGHLCSIELSNCRLARGPRKS